MVLPLTYLVMPVLAGFLVGVAGWRWVVVIVLLCLANLVFYTTMAFQYIFGLSSLEAAIYMMPVQVAEDGQPA
jgi:hypothetical protein